MTRTTAVLVALFSAASIAGCGSSPKTNFYTLTALAPAARTESNASYRVAIGPVTLPDGIDRPQLVLRTGANRMSIAEFERWVGPPKDEIARAIADNLTQLLNGASVFTYPHGADDADLRVQVDVQRFDSVLGEAASIEVLWQVRPAKGEPKTGRSAVREPAPSGGYDALVAAHSRALAAVSRDIAAAIQAAVAQSR